MLAVEPADGAALVDGQNCRVGGHIDLDDLEAAEDGD
jgi:hypothetical protein